MHQLMAAGLLAPAPDSLSISYQGHRFVATLLPSGCIDYQGGMQRTTAHERTTLQQGSCLKRHLDGRLPSCAASTPRARQWTAGRRCGIEARCSQRSSPSCPRWRLQPTPRPTPRWSLPWGCPRQQPPSRPRPQASPPRGGHGRRRAASRAADAASAELQFVATDCLRDLVSWCLVDCGDSYDSTESTQRRPNAAPSMGSFESSNTLQLRSASFVAHTFSHPKQSPARCTRCAALPSHPSKRYFSHIDMATSNQGHVVRINSIVDARNEAATVSGKASFTHATALVAEIRLRDARIEALERSNQELITLRDRCVRMFTRVPGDTPRLIAVCWPSTPTKRRCPCTTSQCRQNSHAWSTSSCWRCSRNKSSPRCTPSTVRHSTTSVCLLMSLKEPQLLITYIR